MMMEGPVEDKSKMSRWQIGNGSLSVLEQVYTLDPFPGLDARRELAKQLNVSPRQVQVWFQNKRQRERKISRAKGQLSTPGLPDTPAAQAAQAALAAKNRMAGEVGAAGHPIDSSSGAPQTKPAAGGAAGAPFAGLTAQGGPSGGAGLLGKAPAAPARHNDFLFGLPMTRACSNPAGFGLDGAGTQLMEDDGGLAPPRTLHSARPFTPSLTLTRSPWAEAGGEAEKGALYRLGISPHLGAQPDRSLADGDVPAFGLSPTAADSRAIPPPPLGGRPMARSMSLDSSLLGGTPLLGGAR